MSSAATALLKRRKAPECEICFKRRIKCDGQRPQCRKCIAKGLKCPGILDEFDLKFRDQSHVAKEKVERRIHSTTAEPVILDKASQNFPKSACSPASTCLSATTATVQRDLDGGDIVEGTTGKLVRTTRPTIGQTLYMPPEMFALSLFFDGHRDMLSSSGAADPWIAYMKPAINSAGSATPLRLAAEAISLAIFGYASERQDAATLAMNKYARCISALRTAISDPKEAAADDTLTTVLLLTIYEYVTSDDHGGKDRFFHHTDGAIAVAVYRRKTGSVSHQQMQMFWVVITSIVMRYTYIGKSRSLTSKTALPVMGAPNRKVAVPRQTSVRAWITGLNAASADPAGNLFELMLRVVILRTKSHDLHLPPMALGQDTVMEVDNLFRSALELHQKLNGWAESLSGAMRPRPHDISSCSSDEEIETSEMWPGKLLQFTSLGVACTYNQWQLLQIMALGVALRNFHWLRLHTGSADQETLFNELRSALYERVDGVCASVPYFLGLSQSALSELETTEAQELSLDGRGALSIAVMLQFCLLVEGVPLVQRLWIQGRLRHIADDVGVRYAAVGTHAASPCLLFEGDSLMTNTFGGRDGHALSTTALSIKSPSLTSPVPSD